MNKGKRGSQDCGMTSKLILRGVQCGKVCMGVVSMQSDEDTRSTKCVQLCTRVYNSRSVWITRRVWRRSWFLFWSNSTAYRSIYSNLLYSTNVRGNNKNNNCGVYTCGEIKETIKESDENNKKTTRGRKTIRTTKSETPKLGDRPRTYARNCGKIIRGADGSCGKRTHADRKEMDEATTMKWGNNEEA